MLKSTTVRLICTIVALAISGMPMAYAAAPSSPYTVEIADVGKSKELAARLKAKGYSVVIPPKNMRVVDEQNNGAVWIGKNVPLQMLQTVLPEAMTLYPHLQFFYLIGDRGEKPPQKLHNTIHIGGSVEAALLKEMNVVNRKEFLNTLASAKTLDQFHKYLIETNRVRESSAPVQQTK
jgi:hypothetical protein